MGNSNKSEEDDKNEMGVRRMMRDKIRAKGMMKNEGGAKGMIKNIAGVNR